MVDVQPVLTSHSPDSIWKMFGRCAVCERPCFSLPDAEGRCESCWQHNARAVDCECGFLHADEVCECAALAAITRCPDCCEPTHAADSNDDGLCKRCMWLRGIAPVTPSAEAA